MTSWVPMKPMQGTQGVLVCGMPHLTNGRLGHPVGQQSDLS